MGEGVQLLEHARVAECAVVGTDRRPQWVLTRRGRTAIGGRTVTAAWQAWRESDIY
jgi:hypothetical protein